VSQLAEAHEDSSPGMEGKRAIRSIQLENLLSFGEPGVRLELLPLNVLIGPNGSGKSNLIEAFALLREAPRELASPIRAGGGVSEWIWKGMAKRATASLEIVAEISMPEDRLRYRLTFAEVGQRFEITDELVERAGRMPGMPEPRFFFGYVRGRPVLRRRVEGQPAEQIPEQLDVRQSVLAQRRDPVLYPEITSLGQLFAAIRLYRDWNFGRHTPARLPQPADLPNDTLLEGAENLGLVIKRVMRDGRVRSEIQRLLREFYADAEDIDVNVEGGTVQLFLRERLFLFPIPATRLSDGTLRWLALLAILLDPSPPPLVCIEEPEIGLHPDMMPTLAQLLRDASQRMQLIVTTHSDTLVDALTDTPEAVVVCEKHEGATTLRRLSRHELDVWLDKYSLGHLWRRGEIGGNRW
jgi:predicted ATPase